MKRTVNLVVAALFLAALFSGCGTPETAPLAGAPTHYTSFRDIPGATPQEIEAIEALQRKYDSFAYGMNPSTEAFYSVEGDIRGYSALFCEWLTELFEIKFIPELRWWGELIEGLENGDIDFIGNMTATDERKKKYYMTEAIAERPIRSFWLSGNPHPSKRMEEPQPVRYAFIGGTTVISEVTARLQGEFEIHLVNNADEAYQVLKSGKADIFITESPVEAAFDVYGDIVSEDFYPLLYSPVSLTAQNPELEPVISLVQKALQDGSIRHLAEMYNQGYQEYRKHKLFLLLDEEELAYINSRSAIPFVAENTNYPVSFYNEHEERHEGVAHEILSQMEMLTGLSFRCENSPDAKFTDLMEMLEEGKAAFITELIRTNEREARFLWPETVYMTSNYALISEAGHRSIGTNEILYETIGLPDATAATELFLSWFPDHANIVRYPTFTDAIEALGHGEVDLVMSSHQQLLFLTNYREMPGYKVNILFDEIYESRFGFHRNEAVLSSIMDKALKLIDTKRITGEWMRKTYDYQLKVTQAKIPLLISMTALFSVVLLFAIFSFMKHGEGKRLEKLVVERTIELIDMKESLELALEQANAASSAKGAFLANMSHEIRTPINAVIGMAAIAEAADDLDKKNEAIGKLRSASSHLLDLINDILDMSKIEANKLELMPVAFDLKDMLEKITLIVRFRSMEKNQELSVHIDQNIPDTLICDDKRLAQVVLNLLGNAVKFTPDGGSISIEARMITMEEDVYIIEFGVRDSGIGISEEQQARLFKSFSQAEASTTRNYGGTGLGLAISKSIVELMGGRIWISSELGKGAIFFFTIKAERADTGAMEAAQPDVPADFTFEDARILLVEDVEINREILTTLLAGTGLVIDEAANGKEAVDMVAAAPGLYDLILMDIQMPEMDGYEATRRIRALVESSGKKLPIIAMTANVFKEDIDKCLAAGMDDHIGKPVDMDVVKKTLRQYLP